MVRFEVGGFVVNEGVEHLVSLGKPRDPSPNPSFFLVGVGRNLIYHKPHHLFGLLWLSTQRFFCLAVIELQLGGFGIEPATWLGSVVQRVGWWGLVVAILELL